MCDKAIDFYMIALKFIADWFVKNKMLENLMILDFLIAIHFFMMWILILSHSLLMIWVLIS